MKTYTWTITFTQQGESFERAGGPHTSRSAAQREMETVVAEVTGLGVEIQSAHVSQHGASSKPELLRRVIRR